MYFIGRSTFYFLWDLDKCKKYINLGYWAQYDNYILRKAYYYKNDKEVIYESKNIKFGRMELDRKKVLYLIKVRLLQI